jgi:hypothetical protein
MADISQLAFVNSHMECAICHEVFKDPRILPCGHTFCCVCLQHQLDSASGTCSTRNLECAYCKAALAVGDGQTVHNLLPKNFAIDTCLSSLPVMDKCASEEDDGDDKHDKVI